MPFVRSKINELLSSGVIVESCSPWRHNVVVVPKGNGDSRLVINYKPVNNCTIFDAYPFPLVETLLDKLGKARFMSSLDFSQCYYQLPLTKEDQEKTAFCVEGKLYQFTRCPFGLTNAVAYCSRLLGKVFENLPNVVTYLDDVIVYGSTEQEHDNCLKQVLKRVIDCGMSLNSKKCSFRQTKITFLGYSIENGLVRPDILRSEPVINFPTPTCVKSLLRFLGMMTYYSKYIPDFSRKARPLYDKAEDFGPWTQEELDSFDELKRSLENAMLAIPSEDEELVLKTDASDRSVAAVLENKSGQPVFFVSRTLNAHERSYDIVEKEALAIHWSVMRLRHFLVGRKFLVYSDHKPLQFIFGNEKASPKVIRWRMQLQEFNFKVIHCSGKSNTVADCLSRVNVIDCLEGDCLVSEKEVLDVQMFDEETKEMLKWLDERKKGKPKNVGSALWKVRSELKNNNGALETDNGRIFVPSSFRHKILTVGHGAHNGIQQTICRIRSKFFWPCLKNSVTDFVQNCRTCSLVKPKFNNPVSAPMLTKAPMEVLSCDFIGPLPNSCGFKYALVLIDCFSRYPFVFPLRDMKVHNIISCFKQLFCLVGFPDSVLTDRGANFESNEFHSFLEAFGVKKLRTNAYHPSSNGICERFNGSLKKMMLSYLTEKGLGTEHWVKSLPHCLLQYRTTPHCSTKMRPVDLMFSFKVKGYLPFSNVDKNRAVSNDLKSKETTKNQLDRKAFSSFFEPGDEVLVKDHCRSKFAVRSHFAIVIKQIDRQSILLRDAASFRIFRCAINRVSRVPHESRADDVDVTDVDGNDTRGEDGEEDTVRRSTRLRRKPDRLQYH